MNLEKEEEGFNVSPDPNIFRKAYPEDLIEMTETIRSWINQYSHMDIIAALTTNFCASIATAVLMIGAILLGISSCATVPAKPLSTGELRLLSMSVPEKEKIKVHSPFVVNVNFEADGSPEIGEACFYFSGDGPQCFKVTDVNYGSPGTIRVQIHTKNAGSRLLECYVLYIRDGKVQPTNMVSTYFRVTPQ